MRCSTTPSPVPAMIHNFKERFLRPLGYCSPPRQEQQPVLSRSELHADASNADDPGRTDDSVTQQQRTVAMAQMVYVPGCTCDFCTMRSETDDVAELICTAPLPHSQSHARRSLPSFRSVMEVLYPPSYLGVPSPFPDPPSYSRSDSPVYPARGDDTEISPLISSRTTNIEGTPLSHNLPDPLAQDLIGVPSQGIPSCRVLLVEPNPPIIDLDDDVPEDLLPAYSRFDQRRPRFPAVSDILGPYPPLSVLCPSAQ